MTEQNNTSHILGFDATVHENMIRNMAAQVHQMNKSSQETSNSYISKIRLMFTKAKISIKQKQSHNRISHFSNIIKNSAGV